MDFPATITKYLQLSGYSESLPNVSIRSQMDAGPDKVRRRASSGVRVIQGDLILTADELVDFKDFYNNDLLGGSLRFNWLDPADRVTTVEMRFTESPTFTPLISSDYFKVNMKLEILP